MIQRNLWIQDVRQLSKVYFVTGAPELPVEEVGHNILKAEEMVAIDITDMLSTVKVFLLLRIHR